MKHEKYRLGTHGGNPMVPEAFDDRNTVIYMYGTPKEKCAPNFEPARGTVVALSREFLIAQYLLSPETELLNTIDKESPRVTLLTGELRRHVEKFNGISRYDATVTRDTVIEYCGRFNLPGLVPLMFERYNSVAP